MMSFGSRVLKGRSALRHFGWIAAIAVGAAAVSGGCGDSPATTGPGSSSDGSTGPSGAGGTNSSTASSDPSTGSGNPTGGQGGASTSSGGSVVPLCKTTALTPTRGSAIALSPDNSRLITVNRDVGTVTVMTVDFSDGKPKMTVVAELAVGAEPWQVAVDGCGHTAYVVLRKDQKVVRIDNLDTTPTVGASVEVGSEPTGLALTPNNTKLYVTNWVDGTLSVIDPTNMSVTSTVDLNKALVDTGKLGTVTPRPGLAHPRAVAITNSGDAADDDESVLVTEWFSLRTGPESAKGTESDVNWEGLVYRVKVSDSAVDTIKLPSVKDTGFKDIKDQVTGCFPNQVASVTIEKGFAYVTSTCASPAGPIGVFTGKNPGSTCTEATATADCGFGGVCNATGKCDPNTRGAKTTTHPGLSIIDLAAGTASTTVLDAILEPLGSARMPLLQSDVGFFNGFAYTSAMGADAVFRITIKDGQITAIGSANNLFINLRKDDADKGIRLPIGIATSYNLNQTFAFVNNDGAREVTALAFSSQTIAGDAAAGDFRITSSSPLPAAGSAEDHVLRGKRFFATGLARWSLNGAAWGSCAACHLDGLSDNVTWYFARGPRQSTSLEGSFASKNPDDQRIFNWTAIFDEMADFEGNVRGISGGLGAIVTTDGAGKEVRIDTAAESPPQQGLQGSSADVADPQGSTAHPHSLINDWQDIESWVKTIRSPRRVKGLDQGDIDKGKAIFGTGGAGNCVGCHGGDKWTISKRFYKPGDGPNAATASSSPSSLSNTSWNVGLNGFPTKLLPAADALTGFMRVGAPPGAEQLQCILRPVGTIAAVGGVVQGVSPADVNVLELRQDMTTNAQGAADTGRGFNPPSLLGMQVGAPFFHAGNARTLEELFTDLFAGHHQSPLAAVFTPSEAQVKQLVAYLLSIDEDQSAFAIPPKGTDGGDICFYP